MVTGGGWWSPPPASCLLEREDVMLQDNKYIGTLRTEDIKCYIKTMRAVEITRTVVTVETQQLPASWVKVIWKPSSVTAAGGEPTDSMLVT